MKSLVLSLFLVLFTNTVVFAQSSDFVVIKGFVNKKAEYDRPITKLTLFETKDGKMNEIATCNVAADKSFGFTFIPQEENIYTIGIKLFRDATPIYIKKGETINIKLNPNEYVLSGKVSKENTVLKKWFDFAQSMRQDAFFFSALKPSIFEDFYPRLDNFFPSALVFAKNNKTKNTTFNNILANYTEGETYAIMLNHMYTPRPKHPTDEQVHKAYKDLVKADYFKTAKLLKAPFGNSLLNQYLYIKLRFAKKDFDTDTMIAMIPNDSLKGQFLVHSLARLKDYGQYLDLTQKYGKYILTDYQVNLSESVAAKLGVTKPGMVAVDFTCTDKDGKKHSLSDYKGKVVYVDVWASWCRPCLAEVPHLMKIEEEFKDKDIIFLGVSVDDNKENWLKMLNKKKMAGIQVWAEGGFESQITKAYKIGSIPRFLLFDKEGNIVSVDAPRPSDPKLKSLLNSVLK